MCLIHRTSQIEAEAVTDISEAYEITVVPTFVCIQVFLFAHLLMCTFLQLVHF